ncbi:BON1-associated protein 2 [Carica papaya]|uniref:BON1-associated protein 2 n=1 Tax=Carica papaya TaxID=3649 RepID=UPI000B8C904F|nr:BON1-associated protein 2 [Carica papaya]
MGSHINTEMHVLEINLISAQGLKEPAGNLRRMQTYALAWVDPSNKLRTRVDMVGGDNPTWNDKFFFRVSPEFLSSETSGVCIEIYAVGCLRDQLIGSVRYLISNLVPSGGCPPDAMDMKSPSFVALQIRRPSGRFRGVLNLGAMVNDGSEFSSKMSELSAIGYRDLMVRRRRRERRLEKSISMVTHTSYGALSEGSRENSFTSASDHSDGGDSTTSSPKPASSPLKDWNRFRNLAGKTHMRSSSDGGGMLCCFLVQKKMVVNDA